MDIRIKRVYEAPSAADGTRILVDRIWPRGLRKEAAAIDAWMKSLAPSSELRKWFGHDPKRWPAFRERYWRELDGEREAVEAIRRQAKRAKVTLLYATRDADHNNAVVLRDYLLSG